MNPENNLQLSYFIQNEIKQTLPWGKPENPYPPVSSPFINISSISSPLVFLQFITEIH